MLPRDFRIRKPRSACSFRKQLARWNGSILQGTDPANSGRPSDGFLPAETGCSGDRAHTSAQEVCGGVLALQVDSCWSQGAREEVLSRSYLLARTGCTPLYVLPCQN